MNETVPQTPTQADFPAKERDIFYLHDVQLLGAVNFGEPESN
jgi:hypothetical protein